MKVRFISDKGYAKAGDVETYPEEEAKNLISEGVAVEFKPEEEPEEEEDKPSIFKRKGITHE